MQESEPKPVKLVLLLVLLTPMVTYLPRPPEGENLRLGQVAPFPETQLTPASPQLVDPLR